MLPVSVALRRCQAVPTATTAVGFEPLRVRTGARSQCIRPLGQTVRWHKVMARCRRVTVDHHVWFACGCPTWVAGVCHGRCRAYLVCPPMSCVWCVYACPSRLGWCWHGCMIRVAVCHRWPLRPAVLCVFPLRVVPGVAACPGLPLIRAVTVDRFPGVVCARCRLLSVGVRLRRPQ